MTTIYKITFDNYQGENFIELYHKEENARARYQELMEEGKNARNLMKKNLHFHSLIPIIMNILLIFILKNVILIHCFMIKHKRASAYSI